MGVRYVIRDLYTGEYLANKFMRGYYLTSDMTKVIKCKTLEDANAQLDKQDLRNKITFTVDAVKFS